jgi:membrane-anchored protein YejM (alkaline phosphatase superfamily)
MGAWAAYGLGSDNNDLPGYLVLNGGQIPSGGLDNFSNGFLPATHRGSLLNAIGTPLANVTPNEKQARSQALKRQLVDRLNRKATRGADELESAVANYELAARMQLAVPEVMSLDGESEATRKLYGFEAKDNHTKTYARECLIARRLIERGVRFVELTVPMVDGYQRWDAHNNLVKNHGNNARAVDQPIAALLRDLKGRGLLDETLVLWSGEFGRTPFAQGGAGRDHNQYGFSLWMAGGGVKPGISYGGTDQWGYKAVDQVLEIHDLHATILHLLGIDHERLTFRFGGRDIRLTDVHGRVIKDLLA